MINYIQNYHYESVSYYNGSSYISKFKYENLPSSLKKKLFENCLLPKNSTYRKIPEFRIEYLENKLEYVESVIKGEPLNKPMYFEKEYVNFLNKIKLKQENHIQQKFFSLISSLKNLKKILEEKLKNKDYTQILQEF